MSQSRLLCHQDTQAKGTGCTITLLIRVFLKNDTFALISAEIVCYMEMKGIRE